MHARARAHTPHTHTQIRARLDIIFTILDFLIFQVCGGGAVCVVVWRCVVWRRVVWRCVVWRYVGRRCVVWRWLWCGVVGCGVVWCSVVWRCVALFGVVWRCMVAPCGVACGLGMVLYVFEACVRFACVGSSE